MKLNNETLKGIKRKLHKFIANDAIENVEGLNSTIDDMFVYAIKEIDDKKAKPLIEMYAKARFHAHSCESLIKTFVIDEYSELDDE